MNYAGMPWGMWLLFEKSFTDKLVTVLKMDPATGRETASQANAKYRQIIEKLPEFEKEDRFKMNIISCAMLSAFLLSLPEKPSVDDVTEYYRNAMMIRPMLLFCRLGGKNKFTDSDIKGMKETAKLKAADRNPYSWNMEFLPYKDGSGYEARFSRCGICTLMKELDLFDYVPAMCRLDYTMSEAGGVTDFIREYTLASGGPYCDCGYKKKGR